MKTMRILCLALLSCCLQAMADNKPKLTINGTTVDGHLTRIMFEGDNALLEFSDADLMEVDMASVMVNFEYEADPIPTGVEDIQELKIKKLKNQVYDLQGRLVSSKSEERMKKGIYIQNGKKIIVK